MNGVELVEIISKTIDERKGFNITALDVRGISTLTDYFIFAEGNVDRHLQAIKNSVTEDLKKVGERPIATEGESGGDWVVIDYGNVIVHLFLPEVREKYRIERIWSEGKIVELSEAVACS